MKMSGDGWCDSRVFFLSNRAVSLFFSLLCWAGGVEVNGMDGSKGCFHLCGAGRLGGEDARAAAGRHRKRDMREKRERGRGRAALTDAPGGEASRGRGGVDRARADGGRRRKRRPPFSEAFRCGGGAGDGPGRQSRSHAAAREGKGVGRARVCGRAQRAGERESGDGPAVLNLPSSFLSLPPRASPHPLASQDRRDTPRHKEKRHLAPSKT